jgi:putative CocE/NonD family hydrolase
MLLLRTPYGIGECHSGATRLRPRLPELTDYIIVRQDIRGRFKSEGQFVMLRQPRDPADKKAIDEGTDTYDTIEWLLKNVSNHNGRVGMVGTSYGAWLSVMGMLDPHPALKAIVQQASPADMWLGDDFHHNGAFRLSYGLEYAVHDGIVERDHRSDKIIDRYDAYEWYLSLGPLSNADSKYFQGRLPTWNDFVKHPDYDAFWKRQGFDPWLNRVTVPTLNVAGWWDQEDFYGPIKIYELLERHDTKSKTSSSLARGITAAGPRATAASSAGRFRQSDRRLLSQKHSRAVLRLLSERQRRRQSAGSVTFRTGRTSGSSTTSGRRNRTSSRRSSISSRTASCRSIRPRRTPQPL